MSNSKTCQRELDPSEVDGIYACENGGINPVRARASRWSSKCEPLRRYKWGIRARSSYQGYWALQPGERRN